MKIQFLGTAACEGIPGLFCSCETCKTARRTGGKNIRTRTQALVDDALLIDFPADTLSHCYTYGVDLTKIKHCIITHTHFDHLHCADIINRKPGFSDLGENDPFHFYGPDGTMKTIYDAVSPKLHTMEGVVELHPIELYQPFQAGDFSVTALEATHDETSFPVFYIIENKEGKRLLYGTDTNFFCDSVWAYLEKEKPSLDFVTLDCTAANVPKMKYIGHMNLADNVKVKTRLMEIGCADEKTVFCSNHFSHNGQDVLYEEFSVIAKKEGFLTSYDGMIAEF